MIKKIFKNRFLLLVILVASLSLVACNGEVESTISDPSPITKQDAEIEEIEAEQIDRYSQILDRSEDEGKLAIYFLHLPSIKGSDHKSGDATLLISPEKEVMLIDAGLSESAPNITSFLEDLGIEKIDYFVASHPHIDHIGGFPGVAKKFEIGKVYRNNMEYTTKTYDNFVNAIEKMQIPVENLKEGDQIIFGDQIQIQIYNPPQDYDYPKDFPKNSTHFVNDHSLVMKFTYGASTALFGGDIYRTKERDLIAAYEDQLQADVIKANHHGGDTSNSISWIKTVKPQIVVAIHEKIDSMSVYENFVKYGADYYNTALNGYVKVLIDDQQNYTLINQFDNWNNEELK